jgi:hypothetical protein
MEIQAPKLVVANGVPQTVNVAHITRCSASQQSSGSAKTNTMALYAHIIEDLRTLQPNTSLLLLGTSPSTCR